MGNEGRDEGVQWLKEIFVYLFVPVLFVCLCVVVFSAFTLFSFLVVVFVCVCFGLYLFVCCCCCFLGGTGQSSLPKSEGKTAIVSHFGLSRTRALTVLHEGSGCKEPRRI